MQPWERWRADFDERLPIYQQIIDHFCRGIVRGNITPGDRIPSIRDMALALKVNANTIQRSYQEMERRQLIYSQRGMGYYVMEDSEMADRIKKEMVQDSISRFSEEMRALGYSNQQIIDEVVNHLEGGAVNGEHAIG